MEGTPRRVSQEERKRLRSQITAKAGDAYQYTGNGTEEDSRQAAIRDVDYLDRVYRKMLGLLVLEECDIKELREHDGWSQERMDTILRKYPIRSLPPADWERFDKEGSRYAEFKKLKNPTRKKLVMKLQEEFGPEGLSGVPGFYQKKDEAWTIAGMDGYLIPQYNQDGKLYRLRHTY